MHSPVPVGKKWKCAKCSRKAQPTLDYLFRTRCDACPGNTDAYSVPRKERYRLLDSFGVRATHKFKGTRARVGSLAAGWKCHLCPFVIPECSVRPCKVRIDHLRAHGVQAAPVLPPAARKKFLQRIVKDAQLKRQDLALEFHEHYTKYHRPVGAHLLVPGARDFPRTLCSHCRCKTCACSVSSLFCVLQGRTSGRYAIMLLPKGESSLL